MSVSLTSPETTGVSLSGLTKSFPTPQGAVHAVRGIDVSICTGKTVALLGPNGRLDRRADPPHTDRVQARHAARVRRSLAALLVCGLVAGCGGGGNDAAKPRRVTIDVARESGRHAVANADGIVKRPAAVAIRVSAAPKQRVVVTWGLSCPKTDEGRDRGVGGTYATTPPDVRALRLPRHTIAFCAVHGDARLSRKGRVKVTLLGSER